MLEIKDYFNADVYRDSIFNTPNDEWSILTTRDINFPYMEDLLGFSFTSIINYRRFNLVPVKFNESSSILNIFAVKDDSLEDGDFENIEIQIFDDDKESLLKIKKEIKEQLKKAIKAPIHTIYLLALMDSYFGWNTTETYDRFIYALSRLKLPKSFRQKQFPLYRGLSISKTAYTLLKQGKSFRLRKRVGTSWGNTKARPIFVARNFNKNGNIIVIELKPNSKSRVILNGYSTKKDSLIKSLLKMSRLDSAMFDEVILKGNGGLMNVTPDMVMNSKGRKLSSFVKASILNQIRRLTGM